MKPTPKPGRLLRAVIFTLFVLLALSSVVLIGGAVFMLGQVAVACAVLCVWSMVCLLMGVWLGQMRSIDEPIIGDPHAMMERVVEYIEKGSGKKEDGPPDEGGMSPGQAWDL